jgi:hypothetical protein
LIDARFSIHMFRIRAASKHKGRIFDPALSIHESVMSRAGLEPATL